MKRIAIDFDEVICDLIVPMLEIINRKYVFYENCYDNYKLTEKDIYMHDIAQILGISSEEMNSVLDEAYNNHAPPVFGAIQSIHTLLHKYIVTILTARPLAVKDATMRWLKENEVQFDNILFKEEWNQNSFFGENIKSAIKIIKGPQTFDIAIDDNIEKLIKINADKKFLFKREWNKRSKNISNLFIVVNSWKDLLQKL